MCCVVIDIGCCMTVCTSLPCDCGWSAGNRSGNPTKSRALFSSAIGQQPDEPFACSAEHLLIHGAPDTACLAAALFAYRRTTASVGAKAAVRGLMIKQPPSYGNGCDHRDGHKCIQPVLAVNVAVAQLHQFFMDVGRILSIIECHVECHVTLIEQKLQNTSQPKTYSQ
jgi:hypothetical protein